jgi:hypothetical protein
MRRILTLALCLTSSAPAFAQADRIIGTLHHGAETITFVQSGRALVVRKRAGARADEYQMLLCNVWQPAIAGHQISLTSLDPVDHITTPPAQTTSDGTEIRNLSFLFDARDGARAAAIVAALKDRPSYCD